MRKAKIADAIDNAEIDRLCGAAHLAGHLSGRHAEHLARRAPVDIFAADKRCNHARILAQVGEQPQLNLRIICANEHIAGAGNKGFSNLPAKRRANRDILKVRLHAGNAAGGGHALLKTRAHPPVLARARMEQAVDKRALELGQKPVLLHQRHDWVVRLQPVQRLSIRGIAGLRLSLRRQAETFEQNGAKLLRGQDVEALARHFINLAGERFGTFFKLALHAKQALLVDAEPDALHIVQHFGERHLHVVIKREQLLLPQRIVHAFLQHEQLRGRCLARMERLLRQLLERSGRTDRIEQIVGNHGVKTDGGDGNAVGGRLMAKRFPVEHQLFHIVVFQQAGKRCPNALRLQHRVKQRFARCDHIGTFR